MKLYDLGWRAGYIFCLKKLISIPRLSKSDMRGFLKEIKEAGK